MVAHSDTDEVIALLARSRLRVWVVGCCVSVTVIVAILVAQLVGPGGAVPSAVGAAFPSPWLVGSLLVAGRPSRPRRFTDKQLQALTMTLSFIVIYLNQAGYTWVLTVAFMAGAGWGVVFVLTIPYFRWQLRRHPWLIHDRARVSGATLIRMAPRRQ
jgi:hypothetical protein